MLSEFETGKLVAHVDKCNKSIEKLSESVELLELRLEKLDNQLSKGRGMYAGILLAAGLFGTALTFDWSKFPWFR